MELTRFGGLVAALIGVPACSRSPSNAQTPVAPVPAPVAPVPAPVATVEAAPAAPVVEIAPAAPPVPAVVLHVGDSMVGSHGGLARALGPRFRALGATYVDESQTSVGIAVFDRDAHFKKLLDKHAPDLVILTLGANDALIPSPWVLAKHVESIAKRAAGPDGKRACYWIGPPMWTKDTGIVAVLEKNAAPCTFFDSSSLKLARRGDGIHPSDDGGEQWASAFWATYRPGDPIAPATPSATAAAVTSR